MSSRFRSQNQRLAAPFTRADQRSGVNTSMHSISQMKGSCSRKNSASKIEKERIYLSKAND